MCERGAGLIGWIGRISSKVLYVAAWCVDGARELMSAICVTVVAWLGDRGRISIMFGGEVVWYCCF